MNDCVRLFLRVCRPLAFWPHGDTGCGLPWPDLPSPPPCGWSTGFIATPRTVGRMPRQRCAPAAALRRRLGAGVHPAARRRRPNAAPALRAGLADLAQVVLVVADLADRRAAIDVHPAH